MPVTLLLFISFILLAYSNLLHANRIENSTKPEESELLVGKVCPVTQSGVPLGILVFSHPWYHSGRTQASYQARDNATGVGVEIHFIANNKGFIPGENIAKCERYRMIQTRGSNALLEPTELPLQIDVPDQFQRPFYDNAPLEHGRGTHPTPTDNQDKPWSARPMRASTVAIYDTPYISDAYGVEGEDIVVKFETCVVCQRDLGYDQLLSCGTWGFSRDYMGGMTGWSEPEFIPVQCAAQPSERYQLTLDSSDRLQYQYWLDWR